MRISTKTLLDQYQARKTVKQKRRFINWLKNHAQEHDYDIKEHTYKSGRGKNLIVGNPDAAKLFLTAHYDTPPTAIFPIFTIVGNIPLYLLSQIFVFIPVIAFFWLIHQIIHFFMEDFIFSTLTTTIFGLEVPVLIFILLIFWCIQMMMGFSNKKNANDNTSGVAVLLSLLEDLSYAEREKVCFVFFDEEEKGLVGSKNFKKSYKNQIKNKPLINFDCVAHGKHLLFIRKKQFQKSIFDDLLAEVSGDAVMADSKKYIYPSDQWIFKNSVGVAALHRLPLLGFYLSRLHSRFDQKFNHENIEILNQIMKKFIGNIS